jgi:GDP-L-fucose synthase
MSFWSDRRVLLTGGGGFFGSALRRRIEAERPAFLAAPRRRELDLLERDAVHRFLNEMRPNLIIHAAATVGGIGANRLYPGRFFYENAMMGIQLIEQARLAAVEKFVCLGTVCAYPKFTPVPFSEDELWNGYPEETNAPYGIAKRALLVQLQAYRAEYGFNGVFLLPVNLYGPADNFDLVTSHVIPAMIRKFIEARERGDDEVVLWGDGSPTREFLYVDDAADAVVLAAERYDGDAPVNVGSGHEMTIRDVAETIAARTRYNGRIVWDSTKPNGQPRRALDVSRAAEQFGFRAQTTFDTGVERTIAWFEANRS